MGLVALADQGLDLVDHERYGVAAYCVEFDVEAVPVLGVYGGRGVDSDGLAPDVVGDEGAAVDMEWLGDEDCGVPVVLLDYGLGVGDVLYGVVGVALGDDRTGGDAVVFQDAAQG